ncbi:MAG: portal protein [Gammaproteobacteria bacterium]|nr:portal protein [Gammaproteobacteria bacterium]
MPIIYALIILLVSLGGFSQEPSALNTTNPKQNLLQQGLNKEEFDIKNANTTFDQINLKLSTQNLNLKDLQIAIRTITKLNDDAEDCIENSQKKLANINNLIQANQIMSITDATKITNNEHKTADQIYLHNELKHQGDVQAQCRLFTIRATEAIAAYQTAATELKKEETFAHSLPIWTFLPKLLNIWNNHKLFHNQWNITLTDVEWRNILYHGLLSFMITAYIFWKFSSIAKLKRLFRLKGEYFPWLTSLLASIWLLLNWGWCSLHANHLEPAGIALCDLTKLLAIFSSLYFLNHFIFSIKRIKSLFYWYRLDFKFFHELIQIIITSAAAMGIGKWFKILLDPNKNTILATQSTFLFVVLFCNIYLIFKFIRIHRHFKWVKDHQKALRNLCVLFSIGCMISNIIGYHVLAMRLLYSGLTILFILFISTLCILAIQKIYAILTCKPLSDRVRFVFGYKESHHPTELFGIKISLQIAIIGISFYLIGQSLGFISYYVDKLYEPILNGIIFSNFTLYPARIVVGIMFFSSLLLISGMLIAGINFTGLAIVAGALSVGIGLGLQSIVNNFVSGLILLIEKPIKPGDRINVDGVEGTVKKIRVRSTQIITPAREDIIVPNSDLITRRVTNYMYTDKYLSINCIVHVAYDSDIKLINELLLQAAYAHDDVIKTGRSKPNVLFKEFGDNSLIFHLWCLIRDANKKSVILSDLNYSILSLFNEHHVVMPIPQQLIYLKELRHKDSIDD